MKTLTILAVALLVVSTHAQDTTGTVLLPDGTKYSVDTHCTTVGCDTEVSDVTPLHITDYDIIVALDRIKMCNKAKEKNNQTKISNYCSQTPYMDPAWPITHDPTVSVTYKGSFNPHVVITDIPQPATNESATNVIFNRIARCEETKLSPTEELMHRYCSVLPGYPGRLEAAIKEHCGPLVCTWPSGQVTEAKANGKLVVQQTK